MSAIKALAAADPQSTAEVLIHHGICTNNNGKLVLVPKTYAALSKLVTEALAEDLDDLIIDNFEENISMNQETGETFIQPSGFSIFDELSFDKEYSNTGVNGENSPYLGALPTTMGIDQSGELAPDPAQSKKKWTDTLADAFKIGGSVFGALGGLWGSNSSSAQPASSSSAETKKSDNTILYIAIAVIIILVIFVMMKGGLKKTN